MVTSIHAKLAVGLLPFPLVVAPLCLIMNSKYLKLTLKSGSKVIEVFVRLFYHRNCAEPQLLSFRIRGEILPLE